MICLYVGHSGSGKDYICQQKKLKMVVSHTTRKPRPGEINGISKWFHDSLPKDQYEKAIAKTYFDNNYYWVTHEDLENKEAFIIDLKGIKDFIEYYEMDFGYYFKIIYVKSCWITRLFRLIKRDGFKKAIKRFLHDIRAFKNVELYATEIIKN